MGGVGAQALGEALHEEFGAPIEVRRVVARYKQPCRVRLEATPAIAATKLAVEPTTPVMDKLEAISAAGEKEAPAVSGATSEGEGRRYCRGQYCRQGEAGVTAESAAVLGEEEAAKTNVENGLLSSNAIRDEVTVTKVLPRWHPSPSSSPAHALAIRSRERSIRSWHSPPSWPPTLAKPWTWRWRNSKSRKGTGVGPQNAPAEVETSRPGSA